MAVGKTPRGRREPGWLATGRARLRLLLEGPAVDGQTLRLAFPPKGLTAPPEEVPFLRFGETLPLPVASIPSHLKAGVSCFPLWEHLLGELTRLTDPERPQAPARLPFRFADLRHLAGRWRELGESELADHLVSAAERQEAWRHGTEAPPPEAVAALPPLAFPTVVSQTDHSLIVWESVLTAPPPVGWVPDEAEQDPAFLQAIHRAQALIQKWFGAGAATRFLCPATHLFGLPIAGGSGGLAMWTALYLALSEVCLPVPALAITGELGDDGAVLGVGEIERKIEVALGCGYPRLIVPAADLDAAPAWMRQDPRIMGVRSCHDVREWLLANDPRFAARRRCFHLARGSLAETPASAAATTAMAALVGDDLRQDRWATTWRTLRRVVRESSRPGRARRWSALVGQWQAALAAWLEENRHRKIDRRVWVGLFRQLVPESIFLLHLPLLLERYGQSERALADQLYARLGYRLADQDLNLDLALRWGRRLFDDPMASPWYQPAFRQHYPLLDWFLFADPLVALDRLLAWPEPTPDERQWRHALFQALARLPPKAAAGVGKQVRAHWRDILRVAAKATVPDFQPALANLTLVDQRPALLLKLWLQHRGQLSHSEADILRAHVDAHLAFRQTPHQLRQTLDRVWGLPDDLTALVAELDQAGARSASPMVRRCRDLIAKLARPGRPGRVARLSPRSWPEHLRAAWRGEGEGVGNIANWSGGQACSLASDKGALTVPGASGRRDCVRALDRHLTEALLGLITGNVVEGAGLAFQMLANPAMVLARLALAGRDPTKQTAGQPDAARTVFRQLGETLSKGVGFRSDLGCECLWHWAGRLVGRQWLPPLGDRKAPLAYWIGRWAVAAPEMQARLEREEIWPRLIELGQKPHLPAMMWLPYLPRRVPAAVREAVAELVDSSSSLGEEERVGRELALWLWWSARPRWSIWRRLAAAKTAWRRIAQGREATLAVAPYRARIADQGLLPLARLWRKWPRVPWRLAGRLARTRGFSPLALAFLLLFPPGQSPGHGRDAPAPGLERLLAAGRLWPLEWERHQACTIALMTLWQAGEVGRLRRLFLSETLDPVNLWLCRDLLRDLDQPKSESRAHSSTLVDGVGQVRRADGPAAPKARSW